MSSEEYRRLRKQIGTQEEVARLIGITANTIARRERGEVAIDPEAAWMIRRLAADVAMQRQLTSEPRS